VSIRSSKGELSTDELRALQAPLKQKYRQTPGGYTLAGANLWKLIDSLPRTYYFLTCGMLTSMSVSFVKPQYEGGAEMIQDFPKIRSVPLPKGSPLDYEPDNEQGVIYLFSHHARRFGLRVERIQNGFPDCIAYRNRKRVRIEFEYRSRNFVLHRHDPHGCDWIVCWIHDWPSAPPHLRVVELRQQFGLGFNVWFQPVSGEYREILAKTKYNPLWSVPSQAGEGDLLLYYRTVPDSYIRDIFRLAGPVRHCRAGWKSGKDWMAPIRRICTLKAPVHLSDLQGHRVIKHAGFVRGSMRGRYKASEYWSELYRMIVGRNPSLASTLNKFGPERLS
jgi:hypothetical protein